MRSPCNRNREMPTYSPLRVKPLEHFETAEPLNDSNRLKGNRVRYWHMLSDLAFDVCEFRKTARLADLHAAERLEPSNLWSRSTAAAG
jgi:hypothetical protein